MSGFEDAGANTSASTTESSFGVSHLTWRMQAVALASVVWSALRVGSNTEAFLSGSSIEGTAGAKCIFHACFVKLSLYNPLAHLLIAPPSGA